VPLGTLVFDKQSPDPICDVIEDGRRYVIAEGGKGGRGNARFVTPTHKAPREFDPGVEGEERQIKLVLKLLADVGIVGLPNVGKSTLISCLTEARPKIGDYPFTTLTPSLGVLQDNNGSFVIADIPGIIEDASKGKGLGLTFLRHIERTQKIMLVLDVSSQSVDGDYYTLLNELGSYRQEMLDKDRIIVLNKIDLTSEDAVGKWEDFFRQKGERVMKVSALRKEGIDRLKALLKGIEGYKEVNP
jgi:GTPase